MPGKVLPGVLSNLIGFLKFHFLKIHIFSNHDRPGWAIQVENRLTIGSDHMNVGRTMIVRIDDDSKSS